MILLKIFLVLATFFFMEFVAWFTHKYIMHGFLWSWHKSHHTLHNHVLEKNDLFAIVFSLPSMVLIVLGYEIEQLSSSQSTWVLVFSLMVYST